MDIQIELEYGKICYEPYAGVDIRDAAKEAIELAKTYKQNIQFQFNDKKLAASPVDTVTYIVDLYFGILNHEEETKEEQEKSNDGR